MLYKQTYIIFVSILFFYSLQNSLIFAQDSVSDKQVIKTHFSILISSLLSSIQYTLKGLDKNDEESFEKGEKYLKEFDNNFEKTKAFFTDNIRTGQDQKMKSFVEAQLRLDKIKTVKSKYENLLTDYKERKTEIVTIILKMRNLENNLKELERENKGLKKEIIAPKLETVKPTDNSGPLNKLNISKKMPFDKLLKQLQKNGWSEIKNYPYKERTEEGDNISGCYLLFIFRKPFQKFLVLKTLKVPDNKMIVSEFVFSINKPGGVSGIKALLNRIKYDEDVTFFGNDGLSIESGKGKCDKCGKKHKHEHKH